MFFPEWDFFFSPQREVYTTNSLPGQRLYGIHSQFHRTIVGRTSVVVARFILLSYVSIIIHSFLRTKTYLRQIGTEK